MIYEIAFSDPTYRENANRLKSGKLKEEEAKEVAKMRERKFVGEETKESVITSQALALGMNVLAKLSARTAKR